MSAPPRLSRAARDALIREHAPLVDRVARRALMRLPPSVQLDDLKSAGMIGLIDAIDKFSLDKGDHFHVYAEIRVRGAIMDELRALDWLPRSARDRLDALRQTRERLAVELGRPPTAAELAQGLGVSEDELRARYMHSAGQPMIFYEDLTAQSGGDALERLHGSPERAPDDALLSADDHASLHKAIKSLPERLRMVVSLYYFEQLLLKDIGELLGVTESRVSQLLAEGLKQLRVTLAELRGGEA
jgi:RNA polymerase sigma factor for flagellar operon FliA